MNLTARSSERSLGDRVWWSSLSIPPRRSCGEIIAIASMRCLILLDDDREIWILTHFLEDDRGWR